MSQVVFTSIDPAEGSTVGRFLVTIDGADFQLTPTPPFGFVGGDFPRTVKVQFDGEDAEDVRVLTAAKLTCVVPAYRGNADLPEPLSPSDVRVVNIDPDTGDELGGSENEATAVDAFQYRRPKFGSSTVYKRLVREVLRTMKRQIHPNVSLTVDVDFDDTVADMLDIIKLSDLPAIVLRGPELRLNRFYSLNDRQARQTGRQFDSRRPPRTVDVVFEIVGVSDSTAVLLDLQAETERFFEVNKDFLLDIDPTDPTAGRAVFEMDLEDELSVDTEANTSNVRHFTGSFLIRGFDIELSEDLQSFKVDDGDAEVIISTESI